jgi:predicted esterase
LVGRLAGQGFGPERIVLLGFSQGACLTLEYAARHARRFAGVAGLSGGLIGPEGTRRDYAGDLAGTPVFLGCSDADPHIPLFRLRETTEVLGGMAGAVEERIYPGVSHGINGDEVMHVRAMLAKLSAADGADQPASGSSLATALRLRG